MADEAQQINQYLALASAKIYPNGVKLAYLKVSDLREQDINARTMDKAMFDQLVNNIAKTQQLESVPLVVMREGVPIIISGHHRTRAAREAGVEYVVCLVYENLTAAEMHAKQLAHNSIAGKDDAQLIRDIFARIDDVEAKLEAFIDPKVFSEPLPPAQFTPVDVKFDTKFVTIAFLPTQAMTVTEALEQIGVDNSDMVILANRDTFDSFQQAYHQIRSDLEIVSAPVAVAAMARLALERLQQLKEDEEQVGME